jgi:excisionase family DNA binding protein
MQSLAKDVVLTTQEAIEYLKISRPTFLKYIRLGRIRATKAGNGWRIHQSELYRFLNVGREALL